MRRDTGVRIPVLAALLAVFVASALGGCRSATERPASPGINPASGTHPDAHAGAPMADAAVQALIADSIAAVDKEFLEILMGYMDGLRDLSRQSPMVTQVGWDRAVMTDLRPTLITELDTFAATHPDHFWAQGFRVGLRMTQQWFQSALDEANACEADEWWCLALQAMALHGLNRTEASELLYREALLAMPRDVRCRWVFDLEVLLETSTSRNFRRISCEAQEAFAETLWWLGDPLFLLPGNDRFTEHMSRFMLMELHHHFLELIGPQTCSWGHHAPMMRGGWYAWEWDEGTHRVTQQLVPADGYRFLPNADIVADPWSAWTLDDDLPNWARSERHTPAWGSLVTLESQIMMFRRDAEVLVVAATAGVDPGPLAPDGTPTLGRFGLALSPGPGEAPGIEWAEAGVPAPSPGTPLRIAARAEDRPWIVSLEALPGGSRVAGRARSGHRPPPRTEAGFGISDLALFMWEDHDPNAMRSLAHVFPYLMGTERVPTERPIGVFWEVYEAQDGPIAFELRLEPATPGFLRRTLSALRLTSVPSPVRVGWVDDEVDPELDGRSLRLDLGRLDPGIWEIVLEVSTPSASSAPLEVRRRIQVVRP
jgi:hypothetical protein